MTALLALPWLLPALAAVAAWIVTVIFGGDWWLATIAATGIAGFVVIWRLVGLKPALAWLLVAAGYLIDQRGAQRGADQQSQKEKVNAAKRADARERVLESADASPDDELRRRARRWVRHDG